MNAALLLLGLIVSPSLASPSLSDFRRTGSEVTTRLSETVSTGTAAPVALMVLPVAAPAGWSAAGRLFDDAFLDALLRSGRFSVAASSSAVAEVVVGGELFIWQRRWLASIRAQDAKTGRWLSVGDFEIGAAKRGEAGARGPVAPRRVEERFFGHWLEGGATTSKLNPGWHASYALRPRDRTWQAILEGGGKIKSGRIVVTATRADTGRFTTSFARLRGDFLFPFDRIKGPAGDTIASLGGWLAVGPGLGVYIEDEHLETVFTATGAKPVSDARHFDVRPSVHATAALALGTRQELRLGVEYVLPAPVRGPQGYRFGGVGLSAGLAFRLL